MAHESKSTIGGGGGVHGSLSNVTRPCGLGMKLETNALHSQVHSLFLSWFEQHAVKTRPSRVVLFLLAHGWHTDTKLSTDNSSSSAVRERLVIFRGRD